MKKIVFSMLAIGLLLLNSCDYRNYGCTDHDALNYDEKANRTDYSCIFETSGVLWWDSSTQFSFNFNNITSMTIELNDEVVASNLNISAFDTIVGSYPNGCYDSKWISYSGIIYSNSASQKLELFNQDDSLFHAQSIYMDDGCSTYEIEF